MVDRLNAARDLNSAALYRRLARNFGYLASGTAASALFMMLAAVLNARALSAREFGLLVLFQSATWMATSFISFSTQQPVIKLGADAFAAKDTARLGRIIGLGLLLDALAAVVATILAFTFLALGRSWLGIGPDEFANAALFATSLLFTGYVTANGVFRLLDRFGLLSLIQIGCGAGILLVTAILYALSARFGAFCVAWAIFFALNSQLPLLVALWLMRRAGIPLAMKPGQMGRGEIATFFGYCWTTWATATGDSLRSNGDSLLVGAAVSVEAAGIYNAAKQLAGILRKFNTVYTSAAFPEISALSAHGQDASAARMRRRMLWVGGVVGAAAVVIVLLVGRPAVALLFGPRFEAAWAPLVILTAAAALQLMCHTLAMYVQVYVGPQRLFAVFLLALAVFVIAVFPLTMAFSMSGTAAAQLLFSLALAYFCHLALRSGPGQEKQKP